MNTKVHQLNNARCLMELRSGRIISADDGFTEMFGYTREDIANGIDYSVCLPCFDAKKIVATLREQFVFSSTACYEHTVMCKDRTVKAVCSTLEIQNTLIKGHRMIEVNTIELSKIVELDTEAVVM